jgi:hypothetical protein
MANFKRKGPKSTRAGCLLCKPHKRQGQRHDLRITFGERRRQEAAKSELAQFEEISGN